MQDSVVLSCAQDRRYNSAKLNEKRCFWQAQLPRRHQSWAVYSIHQLYAAVQMLSEPQQTRKDDARRDSTSGCPCTATCSKKSYSLDPPPPRRSRTASYEPDPQRAQGIPQANRVCVHSRSSISRASVSRDFFILLQLGSTSRRPQYFDLG